MPSWVHSENHMMIAHAVDDGCMPDTCHGLDDIEACQRERKKLSMMRTPAVLCWIYDITMNHTFSRVVVVASHSWSRYVFDTWVPVQLMH